MLLSHITENYPPLNEILRDGDIKNVTSDSRKADGDSLFVCIEGSRSDGHDFAMSAYKNGCRYFAAERKLDIPENAAVLLFEDTRIALAEMSHKIWGDPSDKLKVIGITGTKGKTTTAQLIYHVLNDNGIKTGYIGTNGIMFDGKRIKTSNTTPESSELARYMKEMKDCGVKYLALEVSSQALYMNRVRAVNFDSLIYTNLYPDHIGGVEHPTFEHYRDSKKRLFSQFKSTLVITNGDDLLSDYMTEGTEGHRVEYSVGGKGWIRAENPRLYRKGSSLGVEFDLVVCDKTVKTRLQMPGIFNIHNALAAAVACIKAGVRIEKISASLEKARIEGRFQVLPFERESTFVIDYAHNGASLESVLKVLREYEPERLICVFGSVGGRTKIRRSELAKAASRFCDYCILTSDNPDFEDPELIIDEIAQNMGECPYEREADREKAIERAVEIARDGDIVLFAGKGHEDYQLVRGEKIPFCEKDIVKKCLDRIGV